MGRDRTRIERLEQLSQTGGPVTDVTGTAPIVVTTPSPGVRNVALHGAGAGTVTNVNVTGSDGSVAVTGSPITSSGTIDLIVAIDPLTAKTTPVAADEFILADSAASFANKKITYANLVACGLTNVIRAASATVASNTRNRVTTSSVALTTPASPADFDIIQVLIESGALSSDSVIANSGQTVNGLSTWNLDTTPCFVELIYDLATTNWFVTSARFGTT